MVDDDAARAMRAWAGAATALFGFGLWRLFASAATRPVVGEADPDFERGARHLAKAEVAEPGSNSALLGDKRFLFSTSGDSFLMFGVPRPHLGALGGTVGRREERLELLWRFRELADAHAGPPGDLRAGAEDLPDIVELGSRSRRWAKAPPCRWRPSPSKAASAATSPGLAQGGRGGRDLRES
jgi:phosphatidylglycerol lysyltransferase